MAQISINNNVYVPSSTANYGLMDYSVLTQFYSSKPYRDFSIKYVSSGLESYSVNGNKYDITDKQYLLANQFSEGFVSVDSEKPVVGICIAFPSLILSEVLSNYLRPDAAIADINLDRFFMSSNFLENKYAANNTLLGKFLLEFDALLLRTPMTELTISSEFYYSIAEKIVADYVPIYKQFQSIKAVKPETKKALLRKIFKGKEFIDAFFTQAITVEQISKEVGLSEYHFYRLFKTVYTISPHQYIIRQRLQLAMKILEGNGSFVSEVALHCGFSDIHSFSKSFKNYFGCSPSQFMHGKLCRI
jgi:AraC family transcriptional regulator